jgi:sensor c-di-GMP phosphodiesterase-like protein
MYQAKKAGRDCYRADDSVQPNGPGTNNLRAELRAALAGSELFLVYQPLFALGQRSLLGVEALVRWRHPERGVLLPNDFVLSVPNIYPTRSRYESVLVNEAAKDVGPS